MQGTQFLRMLCSNNVNIWDSEYTQCSRDSKSGSIQVSLLERHTLGNGREKEGRECDLTDGCGPTPNYLDVGAKQKRGRWLYITEYMAAAGSLVHYPFAVGTDTGQSDHVSWMSTNGSRLPVLFGSARLWRLIR